MHPPQPPTVEAPLNRLQQAYFRWAEPYYLRLDEPFRSEARRMDRFLYSRRATGLWIGLACAVAGTAAGLHAAGFPWLMAVLFSGVIALVLMIAAGSAWLMPQHFTASRMLRLALVTGGAAFAGAAGGFLVTHGVRQGGLALADLGPALQRAGARALPVLVVGVLAVLLLTWAVAMWRRQALQTELDREREAREKDLLARQSAEARLQLLQAQIQPHFIFNTLAALQHWVDQGDPRAGPLLRELTGFLRSATEWMGQREVPLETELQVVRRYLNIMQARLGQRLQWQVEEAPIAQGLPVPPGLVLTLVENAIEHGISPSLHGGTVRVQVRPTPTGDGPLRCCVEVCDDGLGLAPGAEDGVGLRNCRSRLAHHGDGSGELLLEAASNGSGTRARLVLPAAMPGVQA